MRIETLYDGHIEVHEQINTNLPYLTIYDAVEGVEARTGFRSKEDVERLIERLRYTMLE